jgi:hypothetical protein
VSPGLLQELRARYETLQALDKAIAEGQGQTTVADLRDSLMPIYLELRAARPPQAESAPGAAPGAQQAAPAQPAPVTIPLSSPPGATPPPVALAAPSSAPVAPGPVFSWRAFIADQAIAVMAYLGGFLLLIATLTFEVSNWNQLTNAYKLTGVTVVYVVFGELGIGLRRVTALRTVGRVYLGVFALMTPLEALAVYRFYLQQQGFPVAGMVCLASFYAAIIYLALAARTRFATYAFLGWGASLAGVIAIPQWANATDGWWLSAMTLAAVALLIPHELGLRRTESAAAWLAGPALWISGIASIAAAPVATVLLLGELGAVASDSASLSLDSGRKLALAVTFIALTALALGWSRVLSGRPAPWAALTTLGWLVAAFSTAACVSLALAFNADSSEIAYTLAATALAIGLAATLLRGALSGQRGLLTSIRILTAVVAVVGLLYGIPHATPNYPLMAACAAGLALGLLYALTGPASGTVFWGVVGGLFALIGAFPVFAASIPADEFYSTTDLYPAATLQLPSLYTAYSAILAAIGVGLRFAVPAGSRPDRLRVAIQSIATVAGVITLATLFGHSGIYAAELLGALGVVALIAGWIERKPIPAGAVAAFFGSLAAVTFVTASQSALSIAALAPVIALVAIIVYLAAGRAYALPLYIVSLLGALATLLRFVTPPPNLPETLVHLPLTLSGISALIVAALMASAAVRERSLYWQIGPAALAFLSVFTASDLWPMVVITLGLASAGAVARWRRDQGWGAPWQVAAALASYVALVYATYGANASAGRTLVTALIFMVAAWLIAWLNGAAWETVAIAPYAVVAYAEIGGLPFDLLPKLAVTVGLTLALAAAGGFARVRLGRPWALALYGAAIFGSAWTVQGFIVESGPAGLLEAALLVYAAAAFVIALIEDAPIATLAPGIYAAAAALAQPDGRALLPLALALAVGAYAVSRTKGAYWALPLYGAAMVAAVASAWQSQTIPTFEPVALAAFAVAAWLLAALESRPEALIIAYVFAGLAIPATGNALALPAWAITLSFAALAWVVALSGFAWSRIPWLHERPGSWLPVVARTQEGKESWRDPRIAGSRVCRVAALVIGSGAAVGGMLATDSFTTGAAPTQVVATALISLTALLIVEGWLAGWRLAFYLAGEAAAFFVTWELRWLGLDNIQAWVIAPGSAQIIIGALLPNDKHINAPRWLGQAFSVAGALVLTLPTLTQSITEAPQWQWVYALVLALEALALTLLAVGLRNRVLALTGSAFVGVAAIRGAIIAISQNLPAPIIIGAVALLLMGLATWLSLRARQGGGGHGGEGQAPGASA